MTDIDTSTQTSTQASAPEPKLTGDEVFDSITGFEEFAIAKAFKRTLGDLAQTDPLQLNRALVFTLLRRGGGLNETEAYKQAQGMGTKQVRDYFAEATDQDPAVPESESGKGDSPAA